MTNSPYPNSHNSDATQQNPNSTVDILLATYNSSDYLAETIESVLGQDFTEWRLLVRDDGSGDCTLDITRQYTQKYPGRIVSIPSEGHCSACKNYSILMSHSSAPYVMFCDHDDVWLPDKISESLIRMKEAEREYGIGSPLLVFTDKQVVDRALNVISDSYFKYQHLNPANINLNRLLVQNIPSGCTMLMNRLLLDACDNIPDEAVMHDHWVSLVAAAFGHIVFLPKPTLLYRQHDQNVFGSSKYGLEYFFVSYRKGIEAVRERFYKNVAQAAAFYERYKDNLSSQEKRVLEEFSNLRNVSWATRRKILVCNRILKTSLLRNIGMLLAI